MKVNGNNVSIMNCNMEVLHYGIQVYDPVDGTMIINNTMSNTVVRGIHIANASNIVVAYNIITDLSENYGIVIENSSDVVLQSNTVCKGVEGTADIACVDSTVTGSGNIAGEVTGDCGELQYSDEC